MSGNHAVKNFQRSETSLHINTFWSKCDALPLFGQKQISKSLWRNFQIIMLYSFFLQILVSCGPKKIASIFFLSVVSELNRKKAKARIFFFWYLIKGVRRRWRKRKIKSRDKKEKLELWISIGGRNWRLFDRPRSWFCEFCARNIFKGHRGLWVETFCRLQTSAPGGGVAPSWGRGNIALDNLGK